MTGRLIAVVGPSGVGKDSVIDALCAARPDLHRVRRTISRPAGAGGETFDAVSAETFRSLVGAGAFCLHWGAHGLHYGIPRRVQDEVAAGRTCIANLSRGVLDAAGAMFPGLLVLSLTARPETLARRLAGRGREGAEAIAARLARDACIPAGPRTVTIPNDGPLHAATDLALAALYPVRA